MAKRRMPPTIPTIVQRENKIKRRVSAILVVNIVIANEIPEENKKIEKFKYRPDGLPCSSISSS
jgi:hypothetical protein